MSTVKFIGFPSVANYEHIEERNNLIDNMNNIDWSQVRKSKAWIARISDSKYALKSYNDIVAIFDIDKNEMIVYGYYSRTTNRHIKKFYKFCYELMYPPINVYNIGIDDYFAEME